MSAALKMNDSATVSPNESSSNGTNSDSGGTDPSDGSNNEEENTNGKRSSSCVNTNRSRESTPKVQAAESGKRHRIGGEPDAGGFESSSGSDSAAKTLARREANRIHAMKSRQRIKVLVAELQERIGVITREKAELERHNALLAARVEVLQEQNTILLQQQQQHCSVPQPKVTASMTTTNSIAEVASLLPQLLPLHQQLQILQEQQQQQQRQQQQQQKLQQLQQQKLPQPPQPQTQHQSLIPSLSTSTASDSAAFARILTELQLQRQQQQQQQQQHHQQLQQVQEVATEAETANVTSNGTPANPNDSLTALANYLRLNPMLLNVLMNNPLLPLQTLAGEAAQRNVARTDVPWESPSLPCAALPGDAQQSQQQQHREKANVLSIPTQPQSSHVSHVPILGRQDRDSNCTNNKQDQSFAGNMGKGVWWNSSEQFTFFQ